MASQTADGLRNAPEPGVEPVGWLVQKMKPQIMQEAKKGGFTEEEAQILFDAADKIPDRFWLWPPGRGDANVTPGDDKAYRGQAEGVISDEALRKKLIEFYERQLGPGGRLRRVE